MHARGRCMRCAQEQNKEIAIIIRSGHGHGLGKTI
jgi:hypothetical protein